MNKNKFATTPPMGWNSYDYYDTTVTEAQVRANAEFMAEHLKEYGWEYVVIDIQWYTDNAGTKRDQYQYIPFDELQMDEYGRFQPGVKRFPSSAGGKGFQPLADYIHSLGLKFGIHIMRGIPRKAAQEHLPIAGSSYTANEVADPSSICIWNPDMYGVRNTEGGQAWYDALIEMYAQWGVDYIKCDDICDSRLYREEPFNGWHETEMLHRAILKSGREIVLSLSPGPAHIDRAWDYCKNANMWRITDDFWDTWELLVPMFWRCELWQDHVKEGCFPDCDMLPFGKLGKGFGEERDTRLTKDEQKTVMTLWTFFRSPLMVGAELTKLDDWTLSMLQNKRLIDRMKATCHGEQVCRNDEMAVWKNKDSADGSICVALFNLTEEEKEISVALDEVEDGLADCRLTELWDQTVGQTADGSIKATVPAHGVKAFRLDC